MTAEERTRYNKAIACIEQKIIGKRHQVTTPTVEQFNALQAAVNAMERHRYETGKPLRRHIAILGYHLANPTAYLFKDEYTIEALEQGCASMKRLMGYTQSADLQQG